jgi:hypothetical protein
MNTKQKPLISQRMFLSVGAKQQNATLTRLVFFTALSRNAETAGRKLISLTHWTFGVLAMSPPLTNMNAQQSLAIQALEQMKGENDNSKILLRSMSDHGLSYYPGVGSRTKEQILSEYEAHDARIDAAIAWVKGQTP